MAHNQSDLNIQLINDDCLEHICRFLSFYERLVLGTTCNRFYHLFRIDVSEREITCTDMDIIARRLPLQLFFYTFGPDIRRINHIKSPNINPLPFLSKYCHNLEYLQIDYRAIDSCEEFDFVKLQNLRTLKVMRGYRITDEFVEKIGQLQRLEVLHINGACIDVELLLGLTTLTELHLSGCSQIKTETFIKVIKSNRNLRRLSILECTTLGSDAFQSLVTTQKNLEYLSFDDSALISCSFLAELPPLMRVDITEKNSTNICKNAIRILALHHSESLEELICRTDSEGELTFPTEASFPRLAKILLQATDCSDEMLTWIYRSCNRLKWFRLEPRIIPIWRRIDNIEMFHKIGITRQQLVNFVNHAKNLTYIAIPLDLLTISLYRELVNIRRNQHAPEPLTLVLKHSSIPYFIKQQISLRKEYPEVKKIVRIRLER